MPFKDSPEGTTHFVGDSCQPPHGSLKEKRLEEFDKTVWISSPQKEEMRKLLSDSIDMAYEEGKKTLIKEAKVIFKEWNCKAESCSDPLCGHGRCVNDMVKVLENPKSLT